ncbi:MAG: acyltransferase [Bacteroidaceae bacterium]|nr:acyltransferase [Bacteroidaceae bacterium]
MFKSLFLHNIIKIVYINFHFLPFRQAIKFPIDIYGKLRIVNDSGKICINGNIRPGMIKLGSQGRDMFPLDPVILDIRGSLCFNGSFYIGCGSTIRVENGANLSIGTNSRFGAQSILFCEDSIKIGSQVGGSWRCQVMDTDRHEIRNLNTGVISPSHKPIEIGDNVWIGNNVFINKGTRIPANIIIASKSLCNKDYSNVPAFSVLAGIPAKVVASDKQRIW